MGLGRAACQPQVLWPDLRDPRVYTHPWARRDMKLLGQSALIPVPLMDPPLLTSRQLHPHQPEVCLPDSARPAWVWSKEGTLLPPPMQAGWRVLGM